MTADQAVILDHLALSKRLIEKAQEVSDSSHDSALHESVKLVTSALSELRQAVHALALRSREHTHALAGDRNGG